MLMGQDAKESPQVDETYNSQEDECSRQLEKSPCKEQRFRSSRDVVNPSRDTPQAVVLHIN